jgi:hypothetical protein
MLVKETPKFIVISGPENLMRVNPVSGADSSLIFDDARGLSPPANWRNGSG